MRNGDYSMEWWARNRRAGTPAVPGASVLDGPQIRRVLRPRGRPQAFIPALVVEYAAKLHAGGRGWSDIQQAIERTGNGTYARNTIKRRALALAGQNGQLQAPPAAAAGAARAPAKKARAGRRRPARRR
jgi:hypothetical protein